MPGYACSRNLTCYMLYSETQNFVVRDSVPTNARSVICRHIWPQAFFMGTFVAHIRRVKVIVGKLIRSEGRNTPVSPEKELMSST